MTDYGDLHADGVTKFNPEQSRDAHGRWSDGSSTSTVGEPSNEGKMRFAAMHRQAQSHLGMGLWGTWSKFNETASKEYKDNENEVRRGQKLMALAERHIKAGRFMEGALSYGEASKAIGFAAQVAGNPDLERAAEITHTLGAEYFAHAASTRDARHDAMSAADKVFKYSEGQSRDYHGRFTTASGQDGGEDVRTNHVNEVRILAESARRNAEGGRWASAAKDMSWMQRHVDALVVDHEARVRPDFSESKASQSTYNKFSDNAKFVSQETDRAVDTVRDHALRNLRDPGSIVEADNFRARDAVLHATGAALTDVVGPFAGGIGSIPVPPPSNTSLDDSSESHHPEVEVRLQDHRTDFGPHMEDKVAEAMAHAGVTDDHIEQFRSEFNANNHWMDRLRTVSQWVTVKTLSQTSARMESIMGGLTDEGFDVLKSLMDAGHLDPDVLIETMITAETSKSNRDSESVEDILRHDKGHDDWHAAHGDEPCTSEEDCKAKVARYNLEDSNKSLTPEGTSVIRNLVEQGLLDADVLKFSDEESRDEHGRWTSGGGNKIGIGEGMHEAALELSERAGKAFTQRQNVADQIDEHRAIAMRHLEERYSTINRDDNVSKMHLDAFKAHDKAADTWLRFGQNKADADEASAVQASQRAYQKSFKVADNISSNKVFKFSADEERDDNKVHALQAAFKDRYKFLTPEGAKVIKRLNERGVLDPTMVNAVESMNANVESYDATSETYATPLTPEGSEIISNLIDRGIIAPGSVSLS